VARARADPPHVDTAATFDEEQPDHLEQRVHLVDK
jgi:hypothetical protein